MVMIQLFEPAPPAHQALLASPATATAGTQSAGSPVFSRSVFSNEDISM
jgi:hypothetical protein